MKKFAYYCKNDSKKENISKCEKININEAIIHFSELKKLDKESFLEIFEVYEI